MAHSKNISLPQRRNSYPWRLPGRQQRPTRSRSTWRCVMLGTILALGACGSPEPQLKEESRIAWLLNQQEIIAAPGEEIAELRTALATDPANPKLIERLAWTLLELGRSGGDPGFYHLAMAVAVELGKHPRLADQGRLVRAQALRNLHRFDEAEALARDLVATRGVALDHMVLGDILQDRGQLTDAAAAYEAMMDLKPGSLAYARVGHLRYLLGDDAGAHQLMHMALRATDPRDRFQQAWILAHGGRYLLGAGQVPEAVQLIEAALERDPAHAYWLLLAQALVADGQYASARRELENLTRSYSSPEALWWLEEVYRQLGEDALAGETRERLLAQSERIDPRGFAAYLIDHDIELERAGRLLEAEWSQRQDLHTRALRAALMLAQDEPGAAWTLLSGALDEGSPDPLAHLVAARAARACGLEQAARTHLELSAAQGALLTPDNRLLAQRLLKDPGQKPFSIAASVVDDSFSNRVSTQFCST